MGGCSKATPIYFQSTPSPFLETGGRKNITWVPTLGCFPPQKVHLGVFHLPRLSKERLPPLLSHIHAFTQQCFWLLRRLIQPCSALTSKCFIQVCFLFLTRRLISEAQRRSLVPAEHRAGVHWQLWRGVLWRQRLVLLLFTSSLHPSLPIPTGNDLQSHVNIQNKPS